MPMYVVPTIISENILNIMENFDSIYTMKSRLKVMYHRQFFEIGENTS